MKIVIAPDSFKGVLTAAEAAEAIAAGVAKFLDEHAISDYSIVCRPIADGGEGTAEALAAAAGAEAIECDTFTPDGRAITAPLYYSQTDRTAFIDQAAAGGLPLVAPDKRNPMLTSSYGTGLMIKAACRLGAEKIVVGIGGSASVDGGMGALQALGVNFFDEHGISVQFPATGADTARIVSLSQQSLEDTIGNIHIIAAIDVDAPLYGPGGAAKVFGPQKGADAGQVIQLERGLRHYASVIASATGRDVAPMPGSGAGGGLAFGLTALAGASMAGGAQLVAEMAGLSEALRGADMLITGEGSCDRQTLMHKAPFEAMSLARRRGIDAYVVAGKVAHRPALIEAGFADVIDINLPFAASSDNPLHPAVAARRLAHAAYALMQSRSH